MNSFINEKDLYLLAFARNKDNHEDWEVYFKYAGAKPSRPFKEGNLIYSPERSHGPFEDYQTLLRYLRDNYIYLRGGLNWAMCRYKRPV